MMNRLIAIFLCILLTGCAIHPLQFTSNPSGATVSFQRGKTWVKRGTTPCTVNMSWPYNKDNARITFPSGVTQDVALNPKMSGAEGFGGFLITLSYIVIFPASIVGAGEVAVGALGVSFLGLLIIDRAYSYPNSTFHVELQPTETQISPSTQKALPKGIMNHSNGENTND